MLGQCLARGLFYVGVVPALVGFWAFRGRFRLVPGGPALLLVLVLLLATLYRLAVFAGYLSDRHLLLVTMCSCFWMAAGTVVVGRWFARWVRDPHAATAWATALFLLLCGGSALKSMETLHADRAGFRAAGYWLAQNASPGDKLVDPYTWAGYYAGRVLQKDGPQSAQQPPVCYVVVDVSPNSHSHLDEVEQAKKLAETGREVRRWDLSRSHVAIYEVGEKTH